MNRFGRNTHFILLSVLFTLALSTTAFSQTSRERNAKKSRAAAAQSDKAARVFSQIMNTREKSIPRDLLDRADAVILHHASGTRWNGISLKPISVQPVFYIRPPEYVTREIAEFVEARLPKNGVPAASSVSA